MEKRRLGLIVLLFSLVLLCSCSSDNQSEPDFTYIPKANEYYDEDNSGTLGEDLEQNEAISTDSTDDSQEERLPGEGQYDVVLASGDGYYLVSKRVENYKEAYTEYGVIDQDANWLVPLANDNEISEAIDKLPRDRNNLVDSERRYEYANNGMFVARLSGYVVPEADKNYGWSTYEQMYGCYMINAETGHCFNVGPFTTRYCDGFCFFLRRNGKILEVIRMDTNGEEFVFYSDPSNDVFSGSTESWNCFGIEGNTGTGRQFGEPSNGLVYLAQKFFDIETAEVVIDLTEYDMTRLPEQFPLKFDEDGNFTFRFRNPAGTIYEATIDTNGDFVEEPHEV